MSAWDAFPFRPAPNTSCSRTTTILPPDLRHYLRSTPHFESVLIDKQYESLDDTVLHSGSDGAYMLLDDLCNSNSTPRERLMS